MSILSHFRGWMSFRRDPAERLIVDSMAMVGELLAAAEARSLLEVAKRYADGPSDDDRWGMWRWLIQTHRSASEQLSLNSDSARLVDRARNIELTDDQRRRFMSSFSPLVDESDALVQLDEALRESHPAWERLLVTIRRVRPRVFLTHAFLKLADISGIETASLFVGALIALGAVQMAFFYEASVRQTASAYWTLNDLIIQGMLVVPVVVALLGLVEVLFFLLRLFTIGVAGGYVSHGVILKYPARLVTVVFLATMLVVSLVGHALGERQFNRFKTVYSGTEESSHEDRQMATVLDRTVLHDVYLVGTTDRTAIFLQRNAWDVPLSSRPPDYQTTLSCVASSTFLGLGDCERRSARGYKVLVMDRALVVCHAKKGQCELAGGETNDTSKVERGLTELSRQVSDGFTASGNHVDQVRREFHSRLDGEFADVREHLDRHRGQIIGKLAGGESEAEHDDRRTEQAGADGRVD